VRGIALVSVAILVGDILPAISAALGHEGVLDFFFVIFPQWRLNRSVYLAAPVAFAAKRQVCRAVRIMQHANHVLAPPAR
jgi:hypothetical protein